MKGISEIMKCSIRLTVVVSDYFMLSMSPTWSIHNEASDMENMGQVCILGAVVLLEAFPEVGHQKSFFSVVIFITIIEVCFFKLIS